MAPPRATVQEESQRPLTKHEIPADKATYIVRKADMEEILNKTFGEGLEFGVSTKNGRWIYYAERELTKLEVSKWIAELDKRKKAKAKEQGARARARASDSSDESGGA